jgi:hypothetical protein
MDAMRLWKLSHRCDPKARILADRHYNRQSVGAVNFVPPGRCLVLLSRDETAFWVTSFPYAQYVKHAWAGAWVCSAFRNEGTTKASTLIKEAVMASIVYFGEPPVLGMITFVDTTKVKPTFVRGRPTWGRVYELAGFEHVGETQGGLLAFQLKPYKMPNPYEIKLSDLQFKKTNNREFVT